MDEIRSLYQMAYGWELLGKIFGRTGRYMRENHQKELMELGLIEYRLIGRPPHRYKTVGWLPYEILLWKRLKIKKKEKI